MRRVITLGKTGDGQPQRGRQIQLRQLRYLLPHRVRQEAAHFPHGLLNLLFCAVLLQELVNVGHCHLAHFAVGAAFEARLIESNWGGWRGRQELSAVGLKLQQVTILKRNHALMTELMCSLCRYC